jgi:hypothetical protein
VVIRQSTSGTPVDEAHRQQAAAGNAAFAGKHFDVHIQPVRVILGDPRPLDLRYPCPPIPATANSSLIITGLRNHHVQGRF